MAKSSNVLLSGHKFDRACVSNMKEDRLLEGKLREMRRVNDKNLSKIYNDKMDIRWLYNKMQSTTEALFYDRMLFVKDVKSSPSKRVISHSDSLTLLKKRTDHLKEKYHAEQATQDNFEDSLSDLERVRTFTDPDQLGKSGYRLAQTLPKINSVDLRCRSNTDGSSKALKARSALLKKRADTRYLTIPASKNTPKSPSKAISTDELFQLKLKELNKEKTDDQSILLSKNYHLRSRTQSCSDNRRRLRATTVSDPTSIFTANDENPTKVGKAKNTDFPPIKPRPRAFTTALSAEF
ncbi:hypothetical protein TrispH2_007324 [Trichoplax sp. H2]|nr:hypothetical protein TrispH2_007324 [Trichoplax sp. H2]|eukprot:RDD40500.1 hypothetical protein TrispH2_007324 [Trichoplax sp. H2]